MTAVLKYTGPFDENTDLPEAVTRTSRYPLYELVQVILAVNAGLVIPFTARCPFQQFT